MKNLLLERLSREMDAKLSGGIYHMTQVLFSYNSNKIEGSNLSEEQTRLIYETNTIGADKATAICVDDITETKNHFRCVDHVILNAGKTLDVEIIKQLHRTLKQGTKNAGKDWFGLGEWKVLPNTVRGRHTTPPEKVDSEIKKLIDSYNSIKKKTFEDIIDFHYHFELIHPFQDGNGRVGRLVMFKECLAHGITPFILTHEQKYFYYRGLSEYPKEKGYLIDTCCLAQDAYKEWMSYFQIP